MMHDKVLAIITVLLIEDSDGDAGLIQARLANLREPSFKLHRVATLQDGLDCLRENVVDIVVLDLTLPDSQGLEALVAIRQASRGIPIVVLSGRADDQLALEVVRRGAQEFFSKNETISESLGRSLQYAIERFHRQRAEREIDSAAYVQRRLYPPALPHLSFAEVAGRCDPAKQVGGDYFDYFMADKHSLMLVIGDVSGHGFGPSLVMAETRAALRTMATTTDDIGVMTGQVNKLLYHEELGTFVLLFIARIDLATGRCRYAAAGQPAELIRADGSTQTLATKDHALGLHIGTQFEVCETQLRLHDKLLLYTDGISERASPSKELFGVARMRELIANCGESTSAQIVDRLFEGANQFAHERSAADDMTAIVLKVLVAV